MLQTFVGSAAAAVGQNGAAVVVVDAVLVDVADTDLFPGYQKAGLLFHEHVVVVHVTRRARS